jgi:hypothetical protein
MFRLALIFMLLLAGASGIARAADTSHAGHALGRVVFPVSCSVEARSKFEHAAALLHHMTYPQARAEFEALAHEAPDCAMAHWGVAMTLFQPLWPTRPGPAELARGREAVAAAIAARPPTERERLFVASAAAFFDDDGTPDYWARIRRWSGATQALHAALPDDPEAIAFHALSLLAAAPADQKVARVQADRAAALLLPMYRANSDHPGAMHYLVHANDVPGRERELLGIVRKYETVAPRNPHALHMPTHIYTRLGDWPAGSAAICVRPMRRSSIRPAREANTSGTSSRTRSSTWSMPRCSRATTTPPGNSWRDCKAPHGWSRASRPHSTSPPLPRATHWSAATGPRRPRCRRVRPTRCRGIAFPGRKR